MSYLRIFCANFRSQKVRLCYFLRFLHVWLKHSDSVVLIQSDKAEKQAAQFFIVFAWRQNVVWNMSSRLYLSLRVSPNILNISEDEM